MSVQSLLEKLNLASWSPVDDLESLTTTQLTAEYLRWRKLFRELCREGVKVSRSSGGIYVEGDRLAYSALLFVRLVVNAKSIEKLLPDCKPNEHWDFSAVASLARNLAEAYLWYFWLCEDDIDDDVRQGRFILTYLHDRGTRLRLFPEDEIDPASDTVLLDLIERFDANPFLKTYDTKARKDALKGHKTPFVQDEVVERMGSDKDEFRLIYRFFSQHTHTSPVSFLRLYEHDRGKGVETVQEKSYMVTAISFASTILASAIDGHLKLFPEAETRAPYITDGDVIRAVERNQGRAKKGESGRGRR